MLKIASRLPNLESLYVEDAFEDILPWNCLLKNRCRHSLKKVVCGGRTDLDFAPHFGTLPVLLKYISKADYLDCLILLMPECLLRAGISTFQKVRESILANYSITKLQIPNHILEEFDRRESFLQQEGSSSMMIHHHVSRNLKFLSHWCNLEYDIPDKLLPLVIERVSRCTRGRSALYERIGTFQLSSSIK